ncbi:MAG: hypothetical protein WD772_06260 [Pseudohongiellaceae bacterium]
MKTLFRTGLLLTLLLSGLLLAQVTDTTQEPQQQVNEETTGQVTVVPADAQTDGSATETETEEVEQNSQARFIPTEQISQDLGVSFPVDI